MERTVKQVVFQTPKPIDVKRVAAYARVSSGKDAMLHSLSAQVSYYSGMIQRHPGWLYSGVYADEALTGTKDDRENFQQLLIACRNGELDMVITKSISRFARNTVTLLQVIRELKELGVDVFFEEQNIHTMSADGELMITILASYAQEESRSASENQKWRVRKGFENGELLNWRHMFGYDIDRNGVKINEAEAEIVRCVFNRFIKGESMTSIARNLNDAGVLRSLGGRWTDQRVRELLSNEKYCGNALLMKRFRNNHIEKRLVPNHGELPMYYAEGTHPAIIEQNLFNKAQERLNSIKAAASTWQPPHLTAFSGMIHCAQCGAKYKRTKKHNYHAWNCAKYHLEGKSSCPGLQIREEILYKAATEALALKMFDEKAFRDRVSKIIAGGDHTLCFWLKDGTKNEISWHPPSRKESWTQEMRAEAKRRTLDRGGKN